MEIEKKYLIRDLPENWEQYESDELEQCYLCTDPTIRIRRKNDSYILTYKRRVEPEGGEQKLCVSDEREAPLTERAYCHLREKADGRVIKKTRVRIPYQGHVIELDIFHGEYEGMYLAEVEFGSEQESADFIPPAWFGEDVSGDYHYTNSYLSSK